MENRKLDTYLSATQAASYLGVTVATVTQWRVKDKIKYYKHPINQRMMFAKEDLDEILRKAQQGQ